MLFAALSTGFVLITCVLAFVKGAGPEKAGALVLLGMLVADPVVHLIAQEQYLQVDVGHLAIDILAWLGFFVIALRARRFWPLWASSLQSIALVAHITRAIDIGIDPLAYAIFKTGFSYGIVLCVILGSIRHAKWIRSANNRPSWRS